MPSNRWNYDQIEGMTLAEHRELAAYVLRRARRSRFGAFNLLHRTILMERTLAWGNVWAICYAIVSNGAKLRQLYRRQR